MGALMRKADEADDYFCSNISIDMYKINVHTYEHTCYLEGNALSIDMSVSFCMRLSV